jgi:hypothetical protein
VTLGLVVATAVTDAVYVLFTSAVVARRRMPAATWSGVWYLLSSFAVISYTNNWKDVVFAAPGSRIGAYLTHHDLFARSIRPCSGAAKAFTNVNAPLLPEAADHSHAPFKLEPCCNASSRNARRHDRGAGDNGRALA